MAGAPRRRLEAARRSRQARAGRSAAPAQGFETCVAGGATGQDHLSRAQLHGARQGGAIRQRPAAPVPLDLHALSDLARRAREPDHPAEHLGLARLRGRDGGGDRPRRQAHQEGGRLRAHRRVLGVQRGLDPRIPAPYHPVGHGEEFRPLAAGSAPGSSPPTSCRRAARASRSRRGSTAPSCSPTTPTT